MRGRKGGSEGGGKDEAQALGYSMQLIQTPRNTRPIIPIFSLPTHPPTPASHQRTYLESKNLSHGVVRVAQSEHLCRRRHHLLHLRKVHPPLPALPPSLEFQGDLQSLHVGGFGRPEKRRIDRCVGHHAISRPARHACGDGEGRDEAVAPDDPFRLNLFSEGGREGGREGHPVS